MHSLAEMSNEDLQLELAEASVDVHICEVLLSLGIHEYGDRESVEDRLAGNRAMITSIHRELQRREVE